MSIDEFLEELRMDFPNYRFSEGKKFMFRPPKTIVLDSHEKSFFKLLTLHELAHAILGHRNFKTDVERLKMETDAWEKVREIAPNYDVVVDENLVQDELDTYRNWLHKKSRCPACGLTRFETPDGQYHCPKCNLI